MKNSEKFTTAKERAEAFCRDWGIVEAGEKINIRQVFIWLNLEAPAEEPLPCIYCGKECRVYHSARGDGCWLVACDYCGYESGHIATKEGAIERHNRVARAAAKKTSDAVQFDDGKRAMCESCTHWHVGCTYGLKYGTDPCEKYEARAALAAASGESEERNENHN